MDNNELTIINCPGCGARLDPTESDRAGGHFTCRYCGAKVRLRRDIEKKTVKPVYVPVFRKPRRRGIVTIIIAAGIAVLAVTAVFLVFRRPPSRAMKISSQAQVPRDATAITSETQSAFPIVCRGDRSISISNQSFTKDGTVLDSGGSCRVFIENSTLVSKDRLVTISGNGSVTIENSNLTGKSLAVQVSGGVNVSISNSNINSDTTAIHATGNSSVTVTNCNLTGPVAARTSGNAAIVLVNTNVKGETGGNIQVR